MFIDMSILISNESHIANRYSLETIMTNIATKGEEDLVLKSARLLLGFFRIAVIFASVILILSLPIMAIFGQDILAEVGEQFVNLPPTAVLWVSAGFVMVMLLIMLLSYFTIDRLRKILASVREGDPFNRTNGLRLRGMGIAIFVIQILSGLLGALIGVIISLLGEAKDGEQITVAGEFGLSLSGILLVLLLIILARVFDRGADMRDELDGTI
jgi:hypothetical protein